MDVIEIERENSFIVVDKTKSERLEILVSQGQKGDKGDPGDISSVKVNGVELEKVGGSVNIPVPTKTSDLTNDSDFQNENEVNALIADALSDFTSLKYEIVQQLPQVGENGVIYLIANSGTTPNVYDEYIYINGSFEMIGTTEVDLSQYYTKTETDDLLDDKADTSDLSSVATSGSYNDLSNKPTIPTKTSDLTNDSGFIDSSEISNQYGTAQNLGYSQEYQNAHNVVVSPTTPTTNEKVWFKKSKNLINLSTITEGKRFIQSGVEYNDANYFITDYIPVEPSANYVVNYEMSAYTRMVFYDSSRTILSVNDTTSAFTTPATCKYIRLGQAITQENNVMLEKGTTSSTYEYYVTPSISVGGDEIYNKDNQEIYSTKEIRIGTWIDGKPLYRKVLVFPNGTETTSLTSYVLSNYGITNVDEIFIVHPSYYSLNAQHYPFQYNDGTAFECNVSATTLYLTLGYLPIAQSKIVITLEYTKTTD